MFHTNLNLKITNKILATVICIIALAKIPVIVIAFISDEKRIATAFLMSMFIFFTIGIFLYRISKPDTITLRVREGFLIVSLSWLIASIEGAIPYLLCGYTTSFASAFFESTASFTTTGASVFSISGMPWPITLWKAICNWLGGMGILVFLVTLLPALGVSGQKIFNAESTGIKMDKVSNKISDSAKQLYLIYIFLTILEFLFLYFGSEMGILEAIINTLSTISTGGVFTHSAGLTYYNDFYVEAVVTIFTLLATINFAIYHYLIQGDFKKIFKHSELKSYICILFVICTILASNLYFSQCYETFTDSVRYAFLQGVSFSSTSGYAVAGYSAWPLTAKLLLLMLMLIGGCAASTASSIKVIRIVIIFKILKRAIYKRIHPRAVVSVKIEEHALQEDTVSQTTAFILAFIAALFAGTFLLSFENYDMETTFSAALTMLTNTGIGFGFLGSDGYFGMFSNLSQILMSLLMILGRLELFTVLILLVPSFWNSDRAKSV